MAKKMKDNLLELRNRYSNSVSPISKEDMAKINKKVNDEMEGIKRELNQKERESILSASKINLRG